MAETYFPFNSVSGDRTYKAEDFAAYFAQIIGDGVIYNTSTALKVVEYSLMTVQVSAGGAWVQGRGYINSVAKSLTLDTADGTLDRIDRVVIRVDFANRLISAEVLTGSYSASPTAPALTRDSDTYELGIADIYVKAGTTAITQAEITDTRLDSNLCGIVTAVIEQADTTDIFNQFEEYFTQFKATYIADVTQWTDEQESSLETWESEQKAAFISWVDSIKDILDETVAGHLQNEIEAEIARATEEELKRFYGMQNSVTEFASDGSITVTNDDGTLLVTKTAAGGVTTITEALTVTDGTTYTKVTTITPATATTNKTIREEYTKA